MIIHSIATYHGTHEVPGHGIVHYYKSKCGAEIASTHTFTQGQPISVGVEPHAHCARCFPDGPTQPPTKTVNEHVDDITGDLQDTDGTQGKEHDPSGLGELQSDDFPGLSK